METDYQSPALQQQSHEALQHTQKPALHYSPQQSQVLQYSQQLQQVLQPTSLQDTQSMDMPMSSSERPLSETIHF